MTKEELEVFIEGCKKQRDKDGIRTVQIDIDVAIEVASLALEKLNEDCK